MEHNRAVREMGYCGCPCHTRGRRNVDCYCNGTRPRSATVSASPASPPPPEYRERRFVVHVEHEASLYPDPGALEATIQRALDATFLPGRPAGRAMVSRVEVEEGGL